MSEPSLYERLGGAFAIAAVLTARTRKTPSSVNGTTTTWGGFQA
jgi:hypothetical protein